MSDLISQAPTEPIIQEEEVAETTPEQETGAPEQPQKESKPLTAEDMRKIAIEEAKRISQSQVAKWENRMNQRITERFAALEENKSVLKLSDEQVQQAQREIISEEQMNAYVPSKPQINGQTQAPSEETMDPGQYVSQQIDMAFQAAGGVEVTPSDKEWAMIEAQLNDPQGSLVKTQVAAIDASRAKAARLKAQQQKAPARVTGTGGEGTVPPTKQLSAEDKISKGLKENAWQSQEPKRKS